MADVTHDLSDDAFHEIHLSGKQLVFLFMATTVVSVVIFLLGVFVGRGVPAQRQSQELTDSAAALATSSPVPAATPAPPPPPAADAAGTAAEEPPSPPAETEELSYKRRLEAESPAAEPLKTPSPRHAPAAPARTSAGAAVAPASQTVIGTAQPGTWVVQVHVLRDRTVAARIVQRLIAKGYPAFLVAAGPPTSTYKVQVGRFRDRADAQKAVERLKKEEQFNSWITR